MIIQKFFFATEIKPFSDYGSNFFTGGLEQPACVDRGYAFQPPCLTPKFETGKVSTEDRRQKTEDFETEEARSEAASSKAGTFVPKGPRK